MFEVPDAKRYVGESSTCEVQCRLTLCGSVRREDLYNSDSEEGSTTPEPEQNAARAKLNASLSSFISIDLPDLTTLQEFAPEDAKGSIANEGDEQPEFEFRLFASSKGPATKVVLTTAQDDLIANSAGTVVSERPLSCYLRGDLSAEERERFLLAAVSGSEVIKRSKERAPGLELPWKLTRISMSAAEIKPLLEAEKARLTGAAERLKDLEGRRKRPGKKGRVVLRKREKVTKEKEAADAKLKMTKEEHLKEKKKRLNREKKLKRRVKEKEKKRGAQDPDEPKDDGSHSEEEESS